eukprot:Rmarinus@m.2242
MTSNNSLKWSDILDSTFAGGEKHPFPVTICRSDRELLELLAKHPIHDQEPSSDEFDFGFSCSPDNLSPLQSDVLDTKGDPLLFDKTRRPGMMEQCDGEGAASTPSETIDLITLQPVKPAPNPIAHSCDAQKDEMLGPAASELSSMKRGRINREILMEAIRSPPEPSPAVSANLSGGSFWEGVEAESKSMKSKAKKKRSSKKAARSPVVSAACTDEPQLVLKATKTSRASGRQSKLLNLMRWAAKKSREGSAAGASAKKKRASASSGGASVTGRKRPKTEKTKPISQLFQGTGSKGVSSKPGRGDTDDDFEYIGATFGLDPPESTPQATNPFASDAETPIPEDCIDLFDCLHANSTREDFDRISAKILEAPVSAFLLLLGDATGIDGSNIRLISSTSKSKKTKDDRMCVRGLCVHVQEQKIVHISLPHHSSDADVKGAHGVSGTELRHLVHSYCVLSENERCTFNARRAYLGLSDSKLMQGADCADVCNVIDPQIAGWISHPEMKDYELDTVAAYLRENKFLPRVAEETVEFRGHTALSVARLKYHRRDLQLTFHVMSGMAAMLEKDDMLPAFFDEMKLLGILLDMQRTGICIDVPTLRSYEKQLDEGMAALSCQAEKVLGHTVLLSSPKELATVLYDELHLLRPLGAGETYDNRRNARARNQRPTGEDVLQDIVDAHPLPRIILQYRSLMHLRGTCVEGLCKRARRDSKGAPDSRIHSCFMQTTTGTGRLSSIDPNLQNIPKGTEDVPVVGYHNSGDGIREICVRDAFYAPEGEVLLDADYSQIEIRLVAHYANDEALIKFISSGGDPFVDLACRIFNCAPDEARGKRRETAKMLSYALIYGCGDLLIAQRLGISKREAANLRKTFNSEIPKLRALQDSILTSARAKGFVTTLQGRKRYLPDLYSLNPQRISHAERRAVNTVIQGSAADVMRSAMIRVHSGLKDAHLRARMLLQIHDEIVLSVPEGELVRTARLVEHSMLTSVELKVPLAVSLSVGKKWGSVQRWTVPPEASSSTSQVT